MSLLCNKYTVFVIGKTSPDETVDHQYNDNAPS